MGTQLRQALRALCFNTDWNYAVFWKLTHQSRMILTLDDAYYDNHEQLDPSQNKCLGDMVENFQDGCYSHDSLGLAVANMSCHVYSLGEGIVGQVAATGKHMWIAADKPVTGASSVFKDCDWWQTQFLAGIRTVVVVAVLPHGVVQFGSLNEVAEDMLMVNHIKNTFVTFQDSSVGHSPGVIQCSGKSFSCMTDISGRSSGSGMLDDCMSNLDRTFYKESKNNWSSISPSLGKSGDSSYPVSLPGGYPDKTLEMINKHGGPDLYLLGQFGSAGVLQLHPENFLMDQQKQVERNLPCDSKYEGATANFRDQIVGPEYLSTLSSHNCYNEKSNLYNITLPADTTGLNGMYFPSNLRDSVASDNQNGLSCKLENLNLQSWKDMEKNLEFQTEFTQMHALDMYNFSAGCELYEALGPAFGKQSFCFNKEISKTDTEMAVNVPVETGSSSLITSDSEHLLEAMVANVCHSVSDVGSQKSFSRSAQSLLTTEKMPESTCDKYTEDSGGYSFDQSTVEEGTLKSLTSSEAYSVRSSKGIISTSIGTCSEHLEKPQAPAKANKKRARPGENNRPRPRDRQLIQDRIKELRDLIPNGSKCSIDSLLERTVKHMLFLQSITKHAGQLSKCTVAKLRTKGGIQGYPSYEQGSSWAVEVGSQLKVCPIIVENINMNGQMVIEMMCDDCCRFLEIAEAVRSLGLTILKGVTEDYGEKTWICFIVEGQNNRSLHRTDILWSLVQMVQSDCLM